MTAIAAAPPAEASELRETTWNAGAVAPAHAVGVAAWWAFFAWVVPALEPTNDATVALAAFGSAVVLGTVVSTVLGVRWARLTDLGAAARHGAFAGAIVAGWIASPVMTLLPLRAAFSPAHAAPERLISSDELGLWLGVQMLSMFQASNAAMLAAVSLVLVAAAAGAMGRGAPVGPTRHSGRVTGMIVLFSTWGLLVAAGLSAWASFLALGDLVTAMMANLTGVPMATCLGLNRVDQFLIAQVLLLASMAVIAASRLRPGPTPQRVERVTTAVVLMCVVVAFAFGVGAIALERRVWLALGLISAATLGGVILRARHGPALHDAADPSTLGALVVFVASVRVVTSAIFAPNVGYGVAGALSSVAWIAPLTQDVAATRPTWVDALAPAQATMLPPTHTAEFAIIVGLMWWVTQRVVLRLRTRERTGVTDTSSSN